MTVARSVADVLTEHVRFEVECIDRMYLNVYQPKLQYAPGLVGYVHRQLGLPIASTAPLARITDRFVAAVQRFAKTEGIPWVDQAATKANHCHRAVIYPSGPAVTGHPARPEPPTTSRESHTPRRAGAKPR